MEETPSSLSVTSLKERIRQLEEENLKLKKELESNTTSNVVTAENSSCITSCINNDKVTASASSLSSSFEGKLTPSQIERYSRQLLLHGGFGVTGQIRLLNSSVLVIGAGGIGSSGTYLLLLFPFLFFYLKNFLEGKSNNIYTLMLRKNN